MSAGEAPVFWHHHANNNLPLHADEWLKATLNKPRIPKIRIIWLDFSEHIVATFDLGGTNMRAATIALDKGGGRMLDQLRRTTPNYLLAPETSAAQRLDDLLDFITGYANSARTHFGATAVSAAFPGPVQGLVTALALPTMWGPDGQSLCPIDIAGLLGALASGRAWQRATVAAQAAGRKPDLVSFAEPLARAVAMLHFSLGLERFIFAGGLAEGMGDVLREAIVFNLPAQGWNTGQNWDAMVQFAPNDDAHALIGGALAFA